MNKLNFFAITYQSDSSIVKGITLEPKREGEFPVVIFNRGGNANFAELDVSTLIYFTAKLAEQGYIIIASNYREQEEYGGEEQVTQDLSEYSVEKEEQDEQWNS